MPPNEIGHTTGHCWLPHYPSKLAREGGIRNFVPNFGIGDRGDGGGVVGFASEPEALEAQLKKYVIGLQRA